MRNSAKPIWQTKKLGEILEKTETINPSAAPNTEFIYIDVSSVSNKTFSIENTTKLKGRDAPSRARKRVCYGDIIFATVRPTLRRIALIPKELDGQVCSTGYFVLRTKETINRSLLFYFLLSEEFNARMIKLQRGASYPAVTDKDILNEYISFPISPTEQKNIVEKLERLFNKTKKLEAIYQQKLTHLEELKKSILKKAFSGELTNTDVDINTKRKS